MSEKMNLTDGKKLSAVRRGREIDQVLNIVVPTYRGATGQPAGHSGIETPNRWDLEKNSQETADNISAAANTIETLPDLELAAQVLVSSILSPQDMISNRVDFEIDNEDLPSEVYTPTKEILDEHFTDFHKIPEILPEAIREGLIEKGSYPLIVIPETALDSVINHGGTLTLESLAESFDTASGTGRAIGILGPSNKIIRNGVVSEHTTARTAAQSGLSGLALAFEEFNAAPEALSEGSTSLWDPKTKITDNWDVLKFPIVNAVITERRIERSIVNHSARLRGRNARRLSMEGYGVRIDQNTSTNTTVNGDNSGSKVDKAMGRARPGLPSQAAAFADPGAYSRRPVGHPLVMKLPPESIIPVYVPGAPERHVGYFLLLDELGNPVHRARGSNQYRQLENRLKTGTFDIKNSISDSAYRQLFGNQPSADKITLQQLQNSYDTIVVADLKARLNNGAYRGNADLHLTEEVRRIMLARQFSNCSTQIVFVPASLLTYFAYDFNEDGIGRSLMDKTKIITTIRSVLMFASTMASVRKAIGNTEVGIELDPEDQDPEATVEEMMHMWSRTRNSAFPLAAGSANDIVSYLSNASVNVVVSGNKLYPETKMSQSDRQVANIDIDTEWGDKMRDYNWQGWGLSPDLIDGVSSANFAESIVSGNLLMAKRITMLQRRTIDQINDHIRKYIYCDGTLYDKLCESVTKTLKDFKEDEIKRLYEYFDAAEIDVRNGETGKPEKDVDARPGYVSDGVSVSRTTPSATMEAAKEEAPKADTQHEQLIVAIVEEIIDSYSVRLPEPDVAKFDDQAKAFTAYGSALESAIRSYMSPDMVQGMDGDDLRAYEAYLNNVLAYYKRDWCRRNNFMPELEDLLDTEGEAGKAVNDSILEHQKVIQEMVGTYNSSVASTSRANANKESVLEKQDEKKYGENFAEQNGGGGGGDWGGSGGGDEWGGGGDDEGWEEPAGDDVGGDPDDISFDDQPVDTSATEESEKDGEKKDPDDISFEE